MARWGRGVRPRGVAADGLVLASIALASCASIGCQVFFAVDEPPASDAAANSGVGGAATTGAAGGGGGTVPLSGCEPARDRPAGSGMCRARELTSLGDPEESKKAPGALCQDDACYVYYERDEDDALMCAACSNLGANTCAPATTAGINGINPYLRRLVNELWIAGPGSAGGNDILVAPLPQPCTAGDAVEVEGPVNTAASETYPAISPDGKLLFFTRCTGNGECRLHSAWRDDATGPFTEAAPVAGIRAGVPGNVDDIRAIPHWNGLGHDLDGLWFSSQRHHAGGTHGADDHDVFVAARASGVAWDAPFGEPALVAELSGPVFDNAPLPVREELWLGSWVTEPNGFSRIYLLDMGCGRRFQPAPAAPYAALSTAAADETSPMFASDGRLLFARAPLDGTAQLFAATPNGPAYGAGQPLAAAEVAHVADTSDVDPVSLVDGRLLFASDREGIFQLWITSSTGPVRVFAGNGEERHPFVDADGVLWFTWGGGSDPAGVLAFAAKDGDGDGEGWGAPQEVEVGHVAGRRDNAPRLSEDGRRLLFTSERDGGFFPGSTTPWMAIRSEPSGAWGEPFALTELAGVGGTSDAWLAPDGCSVTAAMLFRQPQKPAYSRDLFRFEF